MHRSRNKWTEQDSGHHGLPVVERTARGGGTHGRAPYTHGRAPPGARPFGLFFVPFHLPAAFTTSRLYNMMYQDSNETQFIPPNSLHSHHLSS